VFYVINPDVDPETGRALCMEHGWNASPLEEQVSDIIGCGFNLVRISRNYNAGDLPYVMVFKKNPSFP
jgi:hypothetical protein